MIATLLESYLKEFLRTGDSDINTLHKLEDRSWDSLICIFIRKLVRERKFYNKETCTKLITHLHENSCIITQNEWTRDPIAMACFYGEEMVMDCLIDLGYGKNPTSLHRISLNGGMIPYMKRILDEGAAVNTLDSVGRTPLDVAIYLPNRRELIEVLVSRGGKINRSYDRFDYKAVCKGLDIAMRDNIFNAIKDAVYNVYGMSTDIIGIVDSYYSTDGIGENVILSMIKLNRNN